MRVAFIVQVPADTPPNAAVFVAGSLPDVGSWRAAGIQLARATDGTYSGDLDLTAGRTLEYKFTRGTWDTVETTTDGGGVANRRLIVDAATTKVSATVACWAGEPGPAHTVTGTLEIHAVPTGAAGTTRTIRVWLPANYSNVGTPMPVLYLHDGQNCFDRATSAYGSEWQVDETLTRLIADGIVPPLVAVGIDNAGSGRIRDYTFDVDPQDGGGGGAAYAELVLDVIMPFVAARYRVGTGQRATFIGGSSLGALVSLEIARRNPGVFGGVLATSPALWWDNQSTTDDVSRDPGGLRGARVWLDIGTREVSPLTPDPANELAVTEARRLDEGLQSAGIEHRLTVDEGAQHNELAWARRFPAAITYLLAPSPGQT